MKRVTKKSKSTSSKGKPRPDQTPKGTDPDYRGDAPKVRFAATIHAPSNAGADWMNKLEVDRMPDPTGVVRALVTAADCLRLLNQGFEITLKHAYPVQPLDSKLVETDENFRRQIGKRLRKIKGYKKQKGFEDL